MANTWTVKMEKAFQAMRRERNGEPFADAAREEAYQTARSARFTAKPDDAMLNLQLAEQRGDREEMARILAAE